MAASIAITAAEPSGLWGLLKESFAGGTELVKAKTDLSTDALIKAVVVDFGTAEGRSITRDGLNDKLKGSKPAEIKDKCVEILRQAGAVVEAKAPGETLLPLGAGCVKSANMLRKQPRRVGFLVLEAWLSAMPRRRPSRKSRARSSYPRPEHQRLARPSDVVHPQSCLACGQIVTALLPRS